MKYSELKSTVKAVHTEAGLSTKIDNLAKLVLGKIARTRLKERIKIGEITPGSDTSWNIKTQFPGFFALKPNAENRNRCIYFYQSTIPYFLKQTNNSRFVIAEGNGCGGATLNGRTLSINLPTGFSVPDTYYVPYFSMFLVLDKDGSTEKEKPEEDDDTFLFDSVYDDVLIDGILLYLKRREMS